MWEGILKSEKVNDHRNWKKKGKHEPWTLLNRELKDLREFSLHSFTKSAYLLAQYDVLKLKFCPVKYYMAWYLCKWLSSPLNVIKTEVEVIFWLQKLRGILLNAEILGCIFFFHIVPVTFSGFIWESKMRTIWRLSYRSIGRINTGRSSIKCSRRQKKCSSWITKVMCSTQFCHISNETHKLDLQRQTGTQNKYKKCFYCLPNVKSDAHCGTRINAKIKSNRKETKRKQWASWRKQERLKNMRVMGQQQG